MLDSVVGGKLCFLRDFIENNLTAALGNQFLQTFGNGLLDGQLYFGIAQFCLGLTFELHVVHFNGEYGGKSFLNVVGNERRVLSLQKSVRAGIVVYYF